MSELKAIRSGEIYNIIEYEDCYRTDDLYYPKSEVDKAIARNKYKRCLAMAKWCKTSALCDEGLGAFKYRDWYRKWFKRWMKLAEKFKDKEA